MEPDASEEARVSFCVKRDMENRVLKVIRLFDPPRPYPQERWTPAGWIPDGDLEWSGIGGSVDWDPATPEEAAAALLELHASDPNPLA